MPRLSVLMSVYNGERYLRQAVESILAQTFSDFEFIIVDDGSTDNTVLILNGYTDPRLVQLKNETNIGLTRSLNRGLAVARGEYIARQDADDWSVPERLQKQIEFLSVHPEIGVLGSWLQIVDVDGNSSSVCTFPLEDAVIRWSLLFCNPIGHPTVMMRRDVMEKVGGYRPELAQAQDYDLWVRLIPYTRFANLPEVLVYLRKHQMRVTSTRGVDQRRISIQVTQEEMSRVLGEDVPLHLVQGIWALESVSPAEVGGLAALIYRLCRVYLSNRTGSAEEKRLIRKDAARRLFDLGRPRLDTGQGWRALFLACRLDPALLARAWHKLVRTGLVQGA